jgi:hypothetical protein
MRAWRWRERAEAWDAELDRIKRQTEARETEAMARRHVQIALAIQEKAVQRLVAMRPEELTPSELVRWIVAAVQLERQARGLEAWPSDVRLRGRVELARHRAVNVQLRRSQSGVTTSLRVSELSESVETDPELERINAMFVSRWEELNPSRKDQA